MKPSEPPSSVTMSVPSDALGMMRMRISYTNMPKAIRLTPLESGAARDRKPDRPTFLYRKTVIP